jgi:hypothetical protein
MGREWQPDYGRASETLHRGKPAETDRLYLTSLNHSFTLDAVMGFELLEDAEKVLNVLPKRLGKYSLTVHPDKTRLVAFGRPGPTQGNKPGTFDYLGFVRHEVAYTAVMTQKGGHNLVCCHQYPTQTCGWSNPAV